MKKETKYFLSLCWKGDEPRVIQPKFNEKYGNEKYKFTKEILDEMKNTGGVKVTYECEKYVNIIGL